MSVVQYTEIVATAIDAAAAAAAGLPDSAAAAYHDDVISVPASPTGSLTVTVLGAPDSVPADHPAAIARAALVAAGVGAGLYAIRTDADGVEHLHLTLDLSRDEGAQTVAITAAGVAYWDDLAGWRWREYDGQWVRMDDSPA